MLVRVGEFTKQDGQTRKMRFLKISDMTQDQKNVIGLAPDKETKKRSLQKAPRWCMMSKQEAFESLIGQR